MKPHLFCRPRTACATLATACSALICFAPLQAAKPEPTPAGQTRISFLTPTPPYPLQAQMAHIEGSVTVRVIWAADGRVKQVVVIKSGGSILDSNTCNYIKAKWRSLVGKEVTHTLTLDYFLRR